MIVFLKMQNLSEFTREEKISFATAICCLLYINPLWSLKFASSWIGFTFINNALTIISLSFYVISYWYIMECYKYEKIAAVVIFKFYLPISIAAFFILSFTNLIWGLTLSATQLPMESLYGNTIIFWVSVSLFFIGVLLMIGPGFVNKMKLLPKKGDVTTPPELKAMRTAKVFFSFFPHMMFSNFILLPYIMSAIGDLYIINFLVYPPMVLITNILLFGYQSIHSPEIEAKGLLEQQIE